MFIDFVQRTQLGFKAAFKSSLNFALFQIQISKLMRQMLIPLKTQLDFFIPSHRLPLEILCWKWDNSYMSSGCCRLYPTSHGWGWMCGRVVGCVTSISRKHSSPQSWPTWSANCSCHRRDLCGTLDSSQGQTHVSLLCCFSTNSHVLREILFPLPKFVYPE